MSIVPAGSKLVTYDPHHPEWAGNTAEQDSAFRRNVDGLLIERAGSKANKKLIVVHGDDVGEQTSHKIIRYIVDELLSGSGLANNLLRVFSFLVCPIYSHQGARDGFSRFPYDCPEPGYEGNLSANGGTEVGYAAVSAAIRNWTADHPTPAESVFCVVAVHCDNRNKNVSSAATIPVAPYGRITFPGYDADPNGGVDVFKGDATHGFNASNWTEYFKPAAIENGGWLNDVGTVGTGGKSFYFENPWRHAGHKASFFYRQDALKNFAVSFLAGIETVGGAESYEGTGAATLTLSAHATGAHTATGTGAASFALSAAEQGRKIAVGREAASFTLSASERGAKAGVGTGAASLSCAAFATGRKTVAGEGVASLSLSTDAHGRKTTTGAVSASFALSAYATGTALEVRTGTAQASYSLDVAATGQKVGLGTGAVALPLAPSATGWAAKAGRGTATFTLYANARGTSEGASVVWPVVLEPIAVRLDARPSFTLALDATPSCRVEIDPHPSHTIALEVP